jgi:hypothetical protein
VRLRQVFTDAQTLTESEFLRREFGLDLIFYNPTIPEVNSFISKASIIFIATTSPVLWIDFLSSRPEKSVVLFLLGNETYQLETYLLISRVPAIRQAYIYGLPEQGRRRFSWGASIGFLLDLRKPSLSSIMYVLRSVRTGLRKLKESREISYLFPVYRLPQGYSNSFAYQVARRFPSLGHLDSLFSESTLSTVRAGREFDTTFGFVGQSGNLRRMNVISLLTNYQSAKILVREGFGGNRSDVDDVYLETLLRSRFSVIPPGAFNILNHRYSEALIMNRIPVVVANIPTDCFSNNHWTQTLGFLPRYSYRFLLKYCYSLDERSYKNLLKDIQESDFLEVQRIRESLEGINGELQDPQ